MELFTRLTEGRKKENIPCRRSNITSIDLMSCIEYCIENFSKEEASKRIYQYIQDSLALKEKEIELKNSLK